MAAPFAKPARSGVVRRLVPMTVDGPSAGASAMSRQMRTGGSSKAAIAQASESTISDFVCSTVAASKSS